MGNKGEDGSLIEAFEEEERKGRQERLAVWLRTSTRKRREECIRTED